MSWASIAKSGHEKQLVKERLHKEHLKTLNEFGFVKPQIKMEQKRRIDFLLHYFSNKTDYVKEVLDYMNINEWKYSTNKRHIEWWEHDIIHLVFYRGCNIIDEWNLTEEEFPNIFKIYKKYNKPGWEEDEPKFFYISYDLTKFYYEIAYHQSYYVIKFYKNNDFQKYFYIMKYSIFEHLNKKSYIYNDKRSETLKKKILPFLDQ